MYASVLGKPRISTKMLLNMIGCKVLNRVRQLAKVNRGFQFDFLRLENVESRVLRYIMSEAFRVEAEHTSIILHIATKVAVKNFLMICKSASPQKLECFKLQYWRPPPEGSE